MLLCVCSVIDHRGRQNVVWWLKLYTESMSGFFLSQNDAIFDLKYGPIWFQRTRAEILQISSFRQVSSTVSLNITAGIEIMKKRAALVDWTPKKKNTKTKKIRKLKSNVNIRRLRVSNFNNTTYLSSTLVVPYIPTPRSPNDNKTTTTLETGKVSNFAHRFMIRDDICGSGSSIDAFSGSGGARQVGRQSLRLAFMRSMSNDINATKNVINNK